MLSQDVILDYGRRSMLDMEHKIEVKVEQIKKPPNYQIPHYLQLFTILQWTCLIGRSARASGGVTGWILYLWEMGTQRQ